jgi:hypothetical protein
MRGSKSSTVTVTGFVKALDRSAMTVWVEEWNDMYSLKCKVKSWSSYKKRPVLKMPRQSKDASQLLCCLLEDTAMSYLCSSYGESYGIRVS